MRRFFLIALALFASPPAWAIDAAKPVPVAPPAPPPRPVALPPVPMPPQPLPKVEPTAESRALAFELAALLNSESLTRRQLDKAYTETLPKVMANNEQFRVMEYQYPGISAAALKAEEEVVVPGTIAMLPGIHGALADVISAHITASELKELLIFYRSPTGTKVLDGIAEGSDLSRIAQKNLDDAGAPLSAEDLKSATSTAATATILSKLSKEDIQQSVRFGLSPAGRKWKRMGQLILSTAADYQNQNSAEMKAKAQENVMTAVIQYMRDHPSAVRPK